MRNEEWLVKGDKIMEEKKICELSDEALAKVAGGSGGAGDRVRAGSDSRVRLGPGLYYAAIDTLYAGQTAPYLGENNKDDRGIYWYKINFKGKNNILVCEEGVHLWHSRIDFNMDNSILYLSSNIHEYSVNISLHKNNVCFIGKNNFVTKFRNFSCKTVWFNGVIISTR